MSLILSPQKISGSIKTACIYLIIFYSNIQKTENTVHFFHICLTISNLLWNKAPLLSDIIRYFVHWIQVQLIPLLNLNYIPSFHTKKHSPSLRPKSDRLCLFSNVRYSRSHLLYPKSLFILIFYPYTIYLYHNIPISC